MRAYRLLVATFIGAATLSTAVPAQACAIWRSPQEKLRTGYLHGVFSSVAAVTIVDAKYTREPVGDTHLWSATAKIDMLLMGTYKQKAVTFDRGGGSAACDTDIRDGNVLPKRGDKWIVYFWTSASRGQEVWIAYPFDVAVAADPALGLSMEPYPFIKPNVPIPRLPTRR
jgi:hypothetical protein